STSAGSNFCSVARAAARGAVVPAALARASSASRSRSAGGQPRACRYCSRRRLAAVVARLRPPLAGCCLIVILRSIGITPGFGQGILAAAQKGAQLDGLDLLRLQHEPDGVGFAVVKLEHQAPASGDR